MALSFESETPEKQVFEIEGLFPGIKFLPFTPSKMETEIARIYKCPELLYPRAVMEYQEYEKKYVWEVVKQLLAAYKECWIPILGYVTFTMLKFETGLSFEDTLVGIYSAYLEDRLIVRFGLDLPPEGKRLYTKVHKFTTWEERNDPKWMTEVYRG